MVLFFFLLLLCFSFAEQCPSATGSHNSPPVCAQLTSTPHPTLAISFSSSGPGPLPHLVPLSERRQHAQGCSQSKHAHLSIWMIASIIWETLFFPNQFNSCVLIVEQRWHLFCLLEWVRFSFFFFPFCLHALLWMCTYFVGDAWKSKSQSIMDSPWGGPATVCVFVTVPCQEGGLERVLWTIPLWLRKCSSILASLWLANRAFLSAGCTVPVQGALRDTGPLRRSKGSSGIGR